MVVRGKLSEPRQDGLAAGIFIPTHCFSILSSVSSSSSFFIVRAAMQNYTYFFVNFSINPASLICTLSSCASLHSALCPSFLRFQCSFWHSRLQ